MTRASFAQFRIRPESRSRCTIPPNPAQSRTIGLARRDAPPARGMHPRARLQYRAAARMAEARTEAEVDELYARVVGPLGEQVLS